MVHNPSDDEVVLESEDLSRAFLDQIEDDLIMFESVFIDISKGQLNLDTYDEVMRVLHSQKGAAGALCYNVIMAAIHQMEDYLVSWHKEQDAFNLDLLLSKIDVIRRVSALALDASLSRKQFLTEYDNLRLDLRNRPTEVKKILVIDTLHATSILLREQLKGRGFEVTICHDGYEGLGRLLHENYSGVVCGGMVLGMDGPAIVAAIKLNAATSSIPIVMVTSNMKRKMKVEPDFKVPRDEKSFNALAEWLEDHAGPG